MRPEVFGDYLLVDRISTSAMAEVFRARSLKADECDQVVALKRVLANVDESESFARMFLAESRIAKILDHPNIAKVIECGRVDGKYYIAMEYVEGKDLLSLMQRTRDSQEKITPPQAAYIAMKMLDGLEYAHNKKHPSGDRLDIVHRDVSPQNILISYEGVVKVIDFGVAKIGRQRARGTDTGVLKGKFGYMSPEQVRGLPLDRRSDVFSVGIILYEMICGCRLFAGKTEFATLEKVRNAVVPPPRSHSPQIAPDLESVVLRALAKDADDRYQSASDLCCALNGLRFKVDKNWSLGDLSQWMKRVFAADVQTEEKAVALCKVATRPNPVLSRYPPPIPSDANLGPDPISKSAFDPLWRGVPASVAAVEAGEPSAQDDSSDEHGNTSSSEGSETLNDTDGDQMPAVDSLGTKHRFPRRFALLGGTVVFLGALLAIGILIYRSRVPGRASPNSSISDIVFPGTVGDPGRARRGLGIIEVLTDPPGATVSLDGHEIRKLSPLRVLRLPSGTHQLELKKAGYRSAAHKFQATEGETLRFDLVLIPERSSPQ